MLYCIDCGGLPDARTFHELLCQTLDFPLWYGHNLDALYDCLTDRTEKTMLILQNWDRCLFPTAGFKEVFEQVQLECPDFSVLYQ